MQGKGYGFVTFDDFDAAFSFLEVGFASLGSSTRWFHGCSVNLFYGCMLLLDATITFERVFERRTLRHGGTRPCAGPEAHAMRAHDPSHLLL
jgi:hypothetical protein